MENYFSQTVRTSPNHKTCFKSFHRPSKNSFMRTGLVQFNNVECQSKEKNKRRSNFINRKNNNSQPRPSISRYQAVANNQVQDQQESAVGTLKRMNILRFPVSMRKNYAQSIRAITDLLNSPIISKSSMVRDFKCFMSHSSLHDSHLISKKVAKAMKQKLKQLNSEDEYNFRYDELGYFLKKLEEKRCDQLQQTFRKFSESHYFPLSVELMILYIGVHLYSINGNYALAESTCGRMFDLIIKRKADICIPIYMILMVKLKSNLSQWQQCLSYISRALAVAWIHNLEDLQIWCYFEMSRGHFALGNHEESQFFKVRSEMSVLQAKNTIYRDMTQHKFKKELDMVRQHNYTFDLNYTITQVQLSKNPQRQKSNTSLKAQVYAKTITQNFKIKHVSNLIGRLGQQFNRPIDNSCLAMAGNPHFLTHQSGIKNLNIYFRESGESKSLYTMENSFKNILVLKQMVRNMLLEMKWFIPIIES